MRKTSFFLSLIFLCVNLMSASAQELEPKRHNEILKLNLGGLFISNFGGQFEHVINKRFSLAASYRLMPKGSLPFKNQIIEQSDDPQQAEDVLKNIKFGNNALTIETRFYTGKKGYGRGFYIAPFYRHARFNADGLSFDYTNIQNQTSSVQLSGNLKGNTFGLLLGAQWLVGSRFVIDWWIAGPHFGTSDGTFDGKTTRPLTKDEQSSLRSTLSDFDLPLTDEEITVSATGAALKFKGPWGGLRAGLLLGIRF